MFVVLIFERLYRGILCIARILDTKTCMSDSETKAIFKTKQSHLFA